MTYWLFKAREKLSSQWLDDFKSPVLADLEQGVELHDASMISLSAADLLHAKDTLGNSSP